MSKKIKRILSRSISCVRPQGNPSSDEDEAEIESRIESESSVQNYFMLTQEMLTGGNEEVECGFLLFTLGFQKGQFENEI